MIIPVIIFAISLLLTIFLFSISVMRRHKKQSVTQRRKLKELKKKVILKAIIFKIIPIVLAIVFVIIFSKTNIRKLKQDQQSVTIYKDEIQVTMLDNELEKRIELVKVDSLVYGIYLWLVLDVMLYIAFSMSIRKDKSLKEDEIQLLAEYHSGKMMYKISLAILCISFTRLVYEYMLLH